MAFNTMQILLHSCFLYMLLQMLGMSSFFWTPNAKPINFSTMQILPRDLKTMQLPLRSLLFFHRPMLGMTFFLLLQCKAHQLFPPHQCQAHQPWVIILTIVIITAGQTALRQLALFLCMPVQPCTITTTIIITTIIIIIITNYIWKSVV